ncbi:hypothetical protein JTB14_001971 [Gonioctena quinquepunctata]|nr:hypothetical protein JTB14_001971 [Gonioctena quinquepunctata]
MAVKSFEQSAEFLLVDWLSVPAGMSLKNSGKYSSIAKKIYSCILCIATCSACGYIVYTTIVSQLGLTTVLLLDTMMAVSIATSAVVYICMETFWKSKSIAELNANIDRVRMLLRNKIHSNKEIERGNLFGKLFLLQLCVMVYLGIEIYSTMVKSQPEYQYLVIYMDIFIISIVVLNIILYTSEVGKIFDYFNKNIHKVTVDGIRYERNFLSDYYDDMGDLVDRVNDIFGLPVVLLSLTIIIALLTNSNKVLKVHRIDAATNSDVQTVYQGNKFIL